MRLCAEPGCGTVVAKGRCATHARAIEQRRGSPRARGYTRAWEHASRAFRLAYPLCGMRPLNQPPVMSQCFEEGRTTPAVQTDHVVPHRGDTQLFWDRDGNWQALCAACHARKSAAGL